MTTVCILIDIDSLSRYCIDIINNEMDLIKLIPLYTS